MLAKENILRPAGYEREVLIFHTMAQKGVAPNLYGVFPEGRVEQMITNADTLSAETCRDPVLMSSLAKKLAKLHCTKLPLSKTPRDYLRIAHDILYNNWDGFLKALKRNEIEAEWTAAANKIVYSYDVISAVRWMIETLPRIGHRIALVHGDLNLENCLINKDAANPEDAIIILDYEFTCYTYRGMDIGYHFMSRSVDNKRKVITLEYPTREERLHFIRAYIDELKRQPDHEYDPVLDNEEQILLESEFFGLVTELFLVSWFVGEYKTMEPQYKQFPNHPLMYMYRFIWNMEQRKASVTQILQQKGK